MAIADQVCIKRDAEIGDTILSSAKLTEASALLALSAALGERLGRYYMHSAIKNDVLYIYLSHPALVEEFKGQKEQILVEMRRIYVTNKLGSIVTFRQVEARYKSARKETRRETEPKYKERALGEFKINIEDQSLRKTFENIRTTIRSRHEDGQKRSR